MELVRTFLAVPPDGVLREQLSALFPPAAEVQGPDPDKAVGAGHARDRGPQGRSITLAEDGTKRGLTPANRAHGALPRLASSSGGDARDQGGIRWADVAGLHVTLVFLGATSAAQLVLLHERIMALASTLPAFAYTLAGPLLFPDARRPRVLALELLDGAGFAGWQAPLADICEMLGFAREHRRYRPHLSLARLRRAPEQPFAPLAAPLTGVASEIVLYESRAGRYHPLFKLACGGAEQAA